jgi:hypothetical protein
MICGGPAEAIVRASGLPSAPASALREVTHAADTRAVGNGQIADYLQVQIICDPLFRLHRLP